MSTIIDGLKMREAREGDVALIHDLIVALADYERLRDDVVATSHDLSLALFGDAPRAFCEIAEWNGAPVGFALWFYNYSTFRGRHGIYLEDLFVKPEARGRGIGKALITRLARRCADEGLHRLQWTVLDWNAPAIAFYESLGAKLDRDWVGCRLHGDALATLAASAADGATR